MSKWMVKYSAEYNNVMQLDGWFILSNDEYKWEYKEYVKTISENKLDVIWGEDAWGTIQPNDFTYTIISDESYELLKNLFPVNCCDYGGCPSLDDLKEVIDNHFNEENKELDENYIDYF